MNYRGSYRRLRDNATSALLSGIEVYNKPRFEYRDEVVVILTMNAWELLLKAIISKSGGRIFYRKRKGEPYRSLSLSDALTRAQTTSLWPAGISRPAVAENLSILQTYRDNAIHFYNVPGFGSLMYALMQTAIINFKDVLADVFGQDLTDEITWHLLPLGVRTPIDPIDFLRGRRANPADNSRPVSEFLSQLGDAATRVDSEGQDLGRLMTVFDVSLHSTKKIAASDVVVGISSASKEDTIIVTTKLDPNRSHPFRQKDVLERLDGRPGLNSFGWQAVVWRHDMKSRAHFCWAAEEGGLVKWSPEAVAFVSQLSDSEIQGARRDYAASRRRH